MERTTEGRHNFGRLETQLADLLTRLDGLTAEVRGALEQVRALGAPKATAIQPPPLGIHFPKGTKQSDFGRNLQTEVMRTPIRGKPRVTLQHGTLNRAEALLRTGIVPQYYIKRAKGLLLALLLEQSPRTNAELEEITGFASSTIVTTMNHVRKMLLLCDSSVNRDENAWSLRPNNPQQWKLEDGSLQEPLEILARDLLTDHGYAVEEPVLDIISVRMRRVLAEIVGREKQGVSELPYEVIGKAVHPHKPADAVNRLSVILNSRFDISRNSEHKSLSFKRNPDKE